MVPLSHLTLFIRQEMKQILITGSFGFVGSRLAAHFLSSGVKVRLLDLPDHPGKDDILGWLRGFGKPQLIEADICDEEQIRSAVAGCDEVIHSAGLLNSTAPWAHFHRVNVLGTQTLCRACTNQGVPHLTLLSTSDVFGIPGSGKILSEDSPYRPWSEPYADTKIEAARFAKSLRGQGGLKISIVYPGWVYGPGDRQFFPAVMDMVSSGIVFTWHRDEPMEIYFVHIDDLIAGIDTIIRTPSAHNRDYLLLDPATGITPMDLFGIIAKHQGHAIKQVHLPYSLMMFVAKTTQTLARYRLLPSPLLSTTDVKAFGNRFRFSTQRAAEELNWSTKVSSLEGIRQALEWQTSNQPVTKL
ncbi:MAG: hypothetical protein CMK89_01750 [Pseudomonadales bacterium]|nr:hypothetical protein [Pseudomonadales bacterium]